MNKQFNCYLTLEISPGATPGEIRAAWRTASLRSHPDRGGSNAAQAKINVAYSPSYYDAETRSILFSDGEEKLLVRYRHRSGATVNVAYVEKLCELMSFHGASRGLLFCSPGLSGNASGLASRQRIKSYTLESMNSWIEEILKSDKVGPTGDVLASLDNLRNFISGIAPRIN